MIVTNKYQRTMFTHLGTTVFTESNENRNFNDYLFIQLLPSSLSVSFAYRVDRFAFIFETWLDETRSETSFETADDRIESACRASRLNFLSIWRRKID